MKGKDLSSQGQQLNEASLSSLHSVNICVSKSNFGPTKIMNFLFCGSLQKSNMYCKGHSLQKHNAQLIIYLISYCPYFCLGSFLKCVDFSE
jgi:hypothetical protein